VIIKDLNLEKGININESDALIVVDVQNDFMPDGALPVKEGDVIVEGINQIAQKFKLNGGKIIFTQDWHPKDHKSFARMHSGKNPGDEYQTADGAIGPVLWADHCVQGTNGAKFHKNLNIEFANAIIQKGTDPDVDSYSGFLENDKNSETGLTEKLRSFKIKRIFVCGLALDYCCAYTAIDGVDFGFEVYFFIDLTKGIDLPLGNISNCLENMKSKGIKFLNMDGIV